MSLASSSAYRKTKYSALDTAREVKDSIARVHDKLAKFVVFVRTDHLTLPIVRAYWQQERRATLKIETISRELGMDVGEVLTTVRALLEATADLPLPDFCANEAPDLFAAIDSIAPDEVMVGDGRNAAERFQYAIELRTALLNHTLAVLSQRYPSSPFTSLQLATEWTHAFTLLLQEVEEIIIQTQQLICDEATAAQSYLDKFRSDLELLDMQARGASLLVRGDWKRLLADTEKQLLDVLESRHSRLATLTFSELRRPRETGWLEVIAQATLKRAPALGALLLALAGGATLLVPTLQHRTQAAPALPAPITDNSGAFPVLARHAVDETTAMIATIQDEVHDFFNTMPRPRGRVSLTIPDMSTLGRVIDELTHFGYARTEILTLFGLAATDTMSTPVTLDVRWSQGGRPLLLPPYSAGVASAPTNDATVSLSTLTGTFGLRAQEAIAASFKTAPQAAVLPETLPVATNTISDVQFVGDAKPVSSMVVHYVQGGESLAAIAEKYGTTPDAIIGDNHLTAALEYGQLLLVRVTGNVVSTSSAPPPALVGAEGVQSSGSFPAVAAPPTVSTSNYDALVNSYGSTVYPSVDAMPEELRAYYSQTVQQVADFFNVRPGDILGILQAENNNTGLRLYQPAMSSAGAMGVGQIIPQTWNGWRNPYAATHQSDMREIVQYGGLGFDWAARETWRAYQEGRVGLDALANTNADPLSFEDNIAGVARHFADYGVTRDLATADPTTFQERLANAISIYNSGQPLAVAADYTQSAANQKTTGEYVREAMAVANATPDMLVGSGEVKVMAAPVATSPLREAYTHLMDQYLGTKPTAQELTERVDSSSLAADVAAGKLSAEQAARDLWNQTVQAYMAQGRAAYDAGQPVPWPHIYNDETLVVQQIAVQYLGHPLSGQELDALLNAHGGNQTAITQAIATRDDARLFAGARLRFDRLLQRSERGLPIYHYEIAAHLQPLLAGYPTQGLSEDTLQGLLTNFENVVRHQPEYRQLHGITEFTVNPFLPMPNITRGFGVAVDYQAGGTHTGIDLAAPMDPQTGEPTIHAVEAGTVAYVGPLYCDAANACRGDHAVVIDHGNDIYTLYSHNSTATVQPGQQVSAGQAIALQGNEGYSFGSHLHFEVHTGAPFSGDWTEPFTGGRFEDPMKWLPN
jgi:murein DD-endopeptidase MepM/ murein hydrolase activator NlpD